MVKFLSWLYVILLIPMIVGVIFWARNKKRELKKTQIQQKWTPVQILFFKDLPPNFYVSFQFCIGFILATIVCSLLYSLITKS